MTEQQCNEVQSNLFDLFAHLGATDDQLDFTTLYASAREVSPPPLPMQYRKSSMLAMLISACIVMLITQYLAAAFVLVLSQIAKCVGEERHAAAAIPSRHQEGQVSRQNRVSGCPPTPAALLPLSSLRASFVPMFTLVHTLCAHQLLITSKLPRGLGVKEGPSQDSILGCSSYLHHRQAHASNIHTCSFCSQAVLPEVVVAQMTAFEGCCNNAGTCVHTCVNSRSKGRDQNTLSLRIIDTLIMVKDGSISCALHGSCCGSV